MNIPLIKPYIDQGIKDKVLEVLESGYLTEGPVTREFEQRLQNYLGCRHTLAVTSATTGLEVALRALTIGPGDEVIVPDYTYPATASVVPIVGATAVIVDVNRDSMLIDYDAIEAAITEKTKAIIPVSLFGSPLDYERLNKIKNQYGLYIIEDAACSIGAEYNDEKIGNQADITVFSLHPRKFITTGEGGIITTANPDWANWMNSYKHFGMAMDKTAREGVQFTIIGTNYKLSNIQAAVGLGQVKHIDKLLANRIELAGNYLRLLANIRGVMLPRVINNGRHSYQSFCVFIDNRDSIMTEMRGKGIEVQIGTYALHTHKAFKHHPLVRMAGAMSNSKWCFDHALALPLYYGLTMDQQKLIVNELSSVYARINNN